MTDDIGDERHKHQAMAVPLMGVNAGQLVTRKRIPLSFNIPADHDPDPQHRIRYIIQPSRVFRPEGLIVMGSEHSTMIHS